MTIRLKTIVFIGLTLVGLMLVQQSLMRAVVLPGFAESERELVKQRAELSRRVIESEITNFADRLTDWSQWDDMYAYVEDGNRAFHESNLIPSSLASIRVNYMGVFRLDGTSVFQTGVDYRAGEYAEIPRGLAERLGGGSRFLAFASNEAYHQGIMILPEGAMVFCSRPVTNSKGDAPTRGALVTGRWLDAGEINRLAELRGLPLLLDIEPEDSAHPRFELVPARAGSDVHLVRWWHNDIDGARRLRFSTEVPVTITQTAASVSAFLTAANLAASLALGGVMLAVLHVLLLRRLERLSKELSAGRGSGGALRGAQRVSVEGRDELSALASTLNEAFAREEAARAQARAAMEEAERANSAKSMFLANMSHEIRTPMTAILGFADLLRDPEISEETRADHVRTIRSNGEHLLGVINDILDISKIESGRMTVERVPTDPRRIVHEVESLMRVKAAEAGIGLTTAVDPGVPECIESDPVRARQVLLNLVSNAVKFTKEGGVRIEADARSGADGRTEVRVRVTDTGVGLSPEQLERLFSPFVQADASTTRKFGGTGLGLAISRRLARALDGDVTASSTVGVGSTFEFTFAGRVVDKPAGEPGHGSRGVATERLSGTVLLAEDGPDNQRLIGHHLRKAGAEVHVVDTGARAVEAALERARGGAPFGLVLMDMQMPEMDGYEAASTLRRSGYEGAIVALTAHAMSGDREKCLASGCDDYATKPIDRAQLIGTCAAWMGRRSKHAASARAGV